ncbi:phage head spike fiber domain-containing protein [Halomonas caseinilytica]|uniref:phage head spike fiber domain-containing protein n=1 Tax=Halomonas caseinilytica TaxID=438744 RepID=UPI0007E544B1|nr:hypothetical protein [Halomonas caseinilytica]SEM67477.1 hypothetical protein SAMN04487952_1068 [Halomonas caseinilytica]
MASVTFPTRLGGSGITITDDASPETGLANGGHRERFLPALKGTVAMAEYVYQYAAKIDGAAEDAERAEEARGYVEAYAGALKSNIHAHYDQLATLKFSFARGRYQLDEGGERTDTTVPSDLMTISRSGTKWVERPNRTIHERLADTLARQWKHGVSKGALVEPSRTNYFLDSTDYVNNFSVTQNNVTKTPNATTAPDGSLTGCLVEGSTSVSISTSADTFYIVGQSVPAGDVSGAIYLKKHPDGPSVIDTRFRALGDGIDEFEQFELTDDWQYLDVGSITSTVESGFRIHVGGNAKFYVWHANIEDGDSPSSPIITQDTTVTRAADTITRTLGNEYNPNGFSVYAEGRQTSATGTVIYLYSSGLDNSIRVGLPSNSDNVLFVSTGSSLQAVIPLSDFPDFTPGDSARLLLSVDPPNNTVRLTLNGVTVSRSVNEFPVIDTLRVGGVSGNNNNINGTVGDVTMYPIVLTQSQAEEMTA